MALIVVRKCGTRRSEAFGASVAAQVDRAKAECHTGWEGRFRKTTVKTMTNAMREAV